jgi:hypothetical protein
VIPVSWFEIVLAILAAAAAFFVFGLVSDRLSGEAYHRAFRRAELEDIAYHDAHPDCTLAEAHRQRDRVNRQFGM